LAEHVRSRVTLALMQRARGIPRRRTPSARNDIPQRPTLRANPTRTVPVTVLSCQTGFRWVQ
jgi:hypothetical protein